MPSNFIKNNILKLPELQIQSL